MAEMTDHMKKAINMIPGLTVEYHGDFVRGYYEDALDALRDAGVSEAVVTSDKSLGAVVQYIKDTYLGNGVLSTFFFQRAKQLQMKGDAANAENPEG